MFWLLLDDVKDSPCSHIMVYPQGIFITILYMKSHFHLTEKL